MRAGALFWAERHASRLPRDCGCDCLWLNSGEWIALADSRGLWISEDIKSGGDGKKWKKKKNTDTFLCVTNAIPPPPLFFLFHENWWIQIFYSSRSCQPRLWRSASGREEAAPVHWNWGNTPTLPRQPALLSMFWCFLCIIWHDSALRANSALNSHFKHFFFHEQIH